MGLLLGPFLLDYIIIPNFSNFMFELSSRLHPVLVSVPFGIGLGVIQQRGLQHWKVSPSLWTLATTIGIGIPSICLAWLINSGMLDYGIWELPAYLANIILMGLGIGGLQALMLRHKVSKVSSWVWAYLVGFPALGVVAIVIAVVAFILAEPIEKFFYSLGLWKLVYYRDALLMLSVGIALPFVAALLIGLPTGRILERSSVIQSTSTDKGEESPKAEFAPY